MYGHCEKSQNVIFGSISIPISKANWFFVVASIILSAALIVCRINGLIVADDGLNAYRIVTYAFSFTSIIYYFLIIKDDGLCNCHPSKIGKLEIITILISIIPLGLVELQ